MTVSIDKKIVEMAFENGEFEKNVGTSLGTIDKLKRSLNFKGVSDSLTGITSAAKNVSLGGIADGVSALSNRFSAMGIVAITTIANITNSAIQAGTRIAKALTVDPIAAGLNEYETKLNSVQTILANTQKEGTTLDQVTDALNQLNEYSDKTIYNFQQMTRNVGTFTAAGVKLDTSVAAIKGIANLAAISGSNADQASTAMYQLSQALSSGRVALMDWNSVVNAGMGGQVFQDAIKETARLHGVAIDQMIEEEGSFRETLQKGWFTSEILTETLAKFTGDLNEDQLRTMGYTEDQIKSIIKMGQTANDAATKVKTFTQLFNTLKEAAQSGWAQTWEIILGDFEEAKLFFTEVNNILGGMIGESADARNDLLQAWKDLGGREDLIQGVRNAFEAVLAVIKPIKEALTDIFPPITAEQLFNLTKGLKEFTANLKIGEVGANRLRRIFKGVFALVDMAASIISAIAKELFGFTGKLAPAADGLFEFLAKIGDFIVKIRDGAKATDIFGAAIRGLGTFIKAALERAVEFFSSFSVGVDGFKKINLDGVKTFIDGLRARFKPLDNIFEGVKKIVGLIAKLWVKLAPLIAGLSSIIGDAIGGFVDKFMVALDNFDPQRVLQIINGGLFATILLGIKDFIKKGGGAFGGISGIFDTVKESLKAWQTSLKADTLLKIAAALGIMAISIVALSMIDPDKLQNALLAMTAMFAQLGVSLLAFQKITALINPVQMATMAVGLLAISGAMLVMAFALAKLGKLDSKQLLKGMLAMGSIIFVIRATSASLAKDAGNMLIGAAALVVFSIAIRSMGKAVEKLGEMDTGALISGLVGIGVLLTELALFMKFTDLSGMGAIKAVGILILAAALNVMAGAVDKLAAIDPFKITQGLIAFGMMLAEIGVFMGAIQAMPNMLITAAGLAIMAGSLSILADAIIKLGAQSWDGVAKGLVSMGVALLLIGAAAYLIPPTLPITALGLVIMAGALVVLAQALEDMGGMSWDEVGRGLAALGGSLLILSVGLIAMSGSMAGSASLFVAAAGLALLAPALKTMGSMSLKEIGLGLLAIAGAFTIMGIAGAVLTPVVPSLLGLAGAMFLIGAGAAALGIGVLAFSAGLAALAVSGVAGATALITIITMIAGLIPMIVKQLGVAVLTLVDVLVAGAPKLLEGIVTLLNILLDGLIEVGPKIIDTVLTILTDLVTSLAEKMPTLVQAGYDILIAFLSGVRDNIPLVVPIAVDIVTAYIDAVREKLPDLVQSGWEFILAWIDGIALSAEENIPALMDSLRGLGMAIVKGILKGMIEGHKDAKVGIKELGDILIQGFKDDMGINSPSTVFMDLARFIIQGLLLGLKENIAQAPQILRDAADKLVDALKGKYANMLSAGRDLVDGFVQGLKGKIGEAIGTAASMAKQVLETIRSVFDSHSPARTMIELGGDVDNGLAIGIKKFSGVVQQSVKDLGEETIVGFGSAMSRINEALTSDINMAPAIRPVIDLSDVQKGSALIDGLLADKRLNLSSITGKLPVVASPGTNEVNPASTQQTDKTPSVIYTQNNYSPKSLSALEIYRQTRNQLVRAKEMVGS